MAKFKMSYNINTSGLDKKMKDLIKNTNLSPVMDAIGLDMRTQTQLNFRRKRSPDGEPWKEYAKSTLKSYKSQGRTNPQLLTYRTNLRKSVNIYTSNKNSASITSDLIYSATHQYGDDRTITRRTKKGISKPYKRNIPARPYMGITRRMVIRYNKMIKNYIVNGEV